MIFLSIYLLITAIGTIVDVILFASLNAILFPSDIYEKTMLNWFGCWFLYILLAICSPYFFVFKLFVIALSYIYNGIKWLFTVGRK